MKGSAVVKIVVQLATTKVTDVDPRAKVEVSDNEKPASSQDIGIDIAGDAESNPAPDAECWLLQGAVWEQLRNPKAARRKRASALFKRGNYNI